MKTLMNIAFRRMEEKFHMTGREKMAEALLFSSFLSPFLRLTLCALRSLLCVS